MLYAGENGEQIWQTVLQTASQRLGDDDCPSAKKMAILQTIALFSGRASQQAMLQALHDATPPIRAMAVFYLGVNRCYEAKTQVLALLKTDPSLRVRKNAIITLTKLQAAEYLSEIRPYLDIPYTRSAAAEAIRELSAHAY